MSSVLRARRDQRGFTLVELLAALAIIATVMVPITAWGLLAMRQQSELQDRTSTSSSSGLLRTYFTGDVASSKSVALTGGTCPTPTGSTVITVNDGSGPWATYAIGVMQDLDGNDVAGRQSLWRVDCTGVVHDLQIVEDIASATATCGSDPGCAVVRLSVIRREDVGHPIELTVGRRTGV